MAQGTSAGLGENPKRGDHDRKSKTRWQITPSIYAKLQPPGKPTHELDHSRPGGKNIKASEKARRGTGDGVSCLLEARRSGGRTSCGKEGMEKKKKASTTSRAKPLHDSNAGGCISSEKMKKIQADDGQSSAGPRGVSGRKPSRTKKIRKDKEGAGKRAERPWIPLAASSPLKRRRGPHVVAGNGDFGSRKDQPAKM